jgi:hypothetical protein
MLLGHGASFASTNNLQFPCSSVEPKSRSQRNMLRRRKIEIGNLFYARCENSLKMHYENLLP